MGVGFSMSALIYHTKKLVGIMPREISGELVMKDSSLALTLRMTGTDIFYIEKPFNQQNDKFSVLDSLLKRSSEKMMEVVEPYQLAVYYNNVGQDEKALKQIRYIINNIPEEKKWAYNLWGNIYKYDGSDTGNIEKAINKYKIAYELDPNYVLPLYNLGTTYKELNRIDEAIEQLEKVIDIDPNYILAYNALSYCYLEKKDTAKALELYQVLAKVENKDEEDLNMMTNLMFALNDSTSIIKYFQQKDERGEVLSVQEYKLWSFRLYDRGYKDESIKKLKEGIDFYPDDFDMRINLIIYCVVMGNKEEALSAADELIKIDAPVRLGYLFKGYAYAVFRDIPNAKAMLDLSSKDEKIKPFNIYLEAVIAYYENDMEKFYSKLDEHLKYKASFDGLANIPPLDSLKNDTRTQEILKKYGK
jgi:tetratricopeptide (TPR) repeat protein